jgi:uncharacterized membrane protein YcjF (UPF0283 family)
MVQRHIDPVGRSGILRDMDSPYASEIEEVVQMEKSEDGEEERVEVIESENVDEEQEPIQGEKVEETEEPGEQNKAEEEDETEKEKEVETEKNKSRAEPGEGTSAPKKKKSGLPMAGMMVTALGAVGIVGAVLLDPIMNAMNHSHPADIAIGSTQMIGIAVAAVVLVVGIVITVVMRK